MIEAVLLLATVANADPRAAEATQLFSAFCVQTNGSRDRALAVLGNGNALANRLSSETTDKLLGQEGTVGWAISSPSGAGLMLGYSGQAHCEIRVQEADEASLAVQFENLQHGFSTALEDIQKPESKNEQGTVRTFRAFKNGKAVIALSTNAKRVGDQQHLITFDVPLD